MKKISSITLLTLLMLMVSFQGFAQESSTVIIKGESYGSGVVKVEIIKSDYSVERKEYHRKEERNMLVELKREVDKMIEKGYSIKEVSTSGSFTEFYKIFVLIKE